MTKEQEAAALAADKQRLIREGELYRIKVVHAKALVGNALHPDELFKSAVDHGLALAQARLSGFLRPGGAGGAGGFGGLGGLGGLLSAGNLKMVMPYALTVGSFIARRRLLKPVLGLAVVAGIGAAWLLRRKRPAEQE